MSSELFIHPRVYLINSLLFSIAYRTSQILLFHQFFLLYSKRMQHHKLIHKINKYSQTKARLSLIKFLRSKIIFDHASQVKYLSHPPSRQKDFWHTLLILLRLCMTEERKLLIYRYPPISFPDCLINLHFRNTVRDIISQIDLISLLQ